MSLKLYGAPTNPRSSKILLAARLAKVDVELVPTGFDVIATKEFLKKNPLGKIPVLETAEGTIFESNAILRYVARLGNALYGANAFEQGKVDQWLDVTQNELESNFVGALIQVLGHVPHDDKAYAQLLEGVKYALTAVDAQLATTKFIVGDHLTIADIALASNVFAIYTYLFTEEQRAAFPHVATWYNVISALPEWVDLFGRTRYLKVAFKAHKAVEHKHEKPAQHDKPAKQEQKKEAKPEKKAEPKAEKKPEPKPAQEEEEAPVKKEKNPLDLLPPSTFNIDDYKRQYFLDKDVKRQIDLLFQQVDTQGWSFWEILYNKTENEGRILIVTKNMRNGYLQRMDPKFRNYAFGVHGVYGEAPSFQIAGAWLWRGIELPFEIKDHPSYEFHTYNRIDISNEEQRNKWASYWLNQEEGTVNGLAVQDVEYIR